MQLKCDLGIHLAEVTHDCWQGVARLRMCGRNRQPAGFLQGEIITHAFQVGGFQQQTFNDGHDDLAGRRQLCQPFTGAYKYVYAQFFFKFADLAADPGLRGM